MKKWLLIPFLLIVGCAGFHEKRLDQLNAQIDAASLKLETAQGAGNQPVIKAVEEELAALRKEADAERSLAAEELNHRQVLLLTILGVVAGGLKLAGQTFGKAAAV